MVLNWLGWMVLLFAAATGLVIEWVRSKPSLGSGSLVRKKKGALFSFSVSKTIRTTANEIWELLMSRNFRYLKISCKILGNEASRGDSGALKKKNNGISRWREKEKILLLTDRICDFGALRKSDVLSRDRTGALPRSTRDETHTMRIQLFVDFVRRSW